MKTTAPVLFSILACAAIDPSAVWAAGEAMVLPQQEAEVVAEALVQCGPRGKQPVSMFVVFHEASLRGLVGVRPFDQFAASLRRDAQRRDASVREAVEHLLQTNLPETRFELPADFPLKVVLYSQDYIQELRKVKGKPSGWDLFYQKYPQAGGMTTISRPGFSKDGSVAIIYVGCHRDFLWGSGQLWIFRKQDGKWVVQPDAIGPRWVS